MTIKAVVFDAYGTLYDIQSVASVTERAFPGYGELITQIWRMKQLEYTSAVADGSYEDFSAVTRVAAPALDTLACRRIRRRFAAIMANTSISTLPRCKATLEALNGRKLAILSNGPATSLDALVANSGFQRCSKRR